MDRLLIVVLLAVGLAGTRAYNTCSQGTAGTMCGGRYCPPEESTCNNGKCRCVTNRGQNELLCANKVDYFGAILNDPMAWTVNKEEDAELPVPCMYLFSHVKTKVKSDLSPNGKCEISINLFNTRIDGKMYVGGFEIRIKTQGLKFGDKDLVFKAEAQGDQGNYCFQTKVSNNGGALDDDFKDKNAYKCDYSPFVFDVDKDTNRLFLQVGYCGLTAMFRPADKAKSVHEQTWLPGFAFKIDADKDPIFMSDKEVVALNPGTTLSSASGSWRPATDELTYRAFTGPGNEITYPDYSAKCANVKTAFDNCPKANQDEALSKCRFALARNRFVKCYSESGNTPDPTYSSTRILDLYSRCVDTFCQSSVATCMAIKMELQDLSTECKQHAPDELMEMGCMFNVR